MWLWKPLPWISTTTALNTVISAYVVWYDCRIRFGMKWDVVSQIIRYTLSILSYQTQHAAYCSTAIMSRHPSPLIMHAYPHHDYHRCHQSSRRHRTAATVSRTTIRGTKSRNIKTPKKLPCQCFSRKLDCLVHTSRLHNHSVASWGVRYGTSTQSSLHLDQNCCQYRFLQLHIPSFTSMILEHPS